MGGISGGIMSNLTGIPFDRFRVLVAQDTLSSVSVMGHLKETFASPKAAFIGGFARIGMKQMATTLNLYVPPDFREKNPFLASFLVGAGFSPILNIPRILQLGRISGERYPETAKSLFTSFGGLRTYAMNTAMFAPGEGLRMMMCFGTKDFLMPKIGGKTDPGNVDSIPLYAGRMSLIAGPSVAAVETTFALATETVSTIHAKMHSSKGDASKSFSQVLKETITPNYTGRCWISLCAKNVMANTPLFWIMFTADFYTRLAQRK
mmetsp:Transcript_41601/g.79668  ORF Transcript_41601/g.79668 Transcript_41601/m.79668 type:complete len:263 (-) Transcript_41601:76-864(-)